MAVLLAACGGSAGTGAGGTDTGVPSSLEATQAPAARESILAKSSEAGGSDGQSETADLTTSSVNASVATSLTEALQVVPNVEAGFGIDAVDLQAIDPQAVMAQVLGSPEILSCVSGKIGFRTMMELTGRGPTGDEITLILPCLAVSDGEMPASSSVTSSISSAWQERIDSALETKTCSAEPPSGYPSTYYSGPLIDSHLHIPALPDDPFGNFGLTSGSYTAGGVDAALYDAIASEDRPFLGRTVKIGDIVCSLQAEGSIRAFSFFPVYQDIEVQLIEVAKQTMEAYPTLFVPFIQTSGSQASTVEANIFEEYLTLSPGLFFGQGEVGDSPTEPINPPPDSVLYTENFEVDRANNMPVYFHPGVGHQENMARALESFPDITFIVHGDFVRPYIDDLMDRYPNIYFTYNDIFDELTSAFRFGSKEDFVTAFERDWDVMLENAVGMYKSMIEAHPDRYMWGTDRADIAWNYDTEVGKLISDFGRAFIGKFDPEIQEKIAYKNAEDIVAKYGYP